MQKRSEVCKRCSYAAFCVPKGHERFFYDARKVAGFRYGMTFDADVMNKAVGQVLAFYMSIPQECPHHPAKENMRDVIAAMQALSV